MDRYTRYALYSIHYIFCLESLFRVFVKVMRDMNVLVQALCKGFKSGLYVACELLGMQLKPWSSAQGQVISDEALKLKIACLGWYHNSSTMVELSFFCPSDYSCPYKPSFT